MQKYSLPTEELSPFVKRFYEIDIPHPSIFDDNRIIPMGTGIITFITRGNPRIENIKSIFKFPNYALSGQCLPTFSFESNTPLTFYGTTLKPTATYKMFDIYLPGIKAILIIPLWRAKKLRESKKKRTDWQEPVSPFLI